MAGDVKRTRRAAGLAALAAIFAMLTAQSIHAQTTTPAPTDTTLWLTTFDEAWSLIDRTHFDPEFNGVDWAAVREELRPRAAEATSNADLRAILRDMIGRLGQSHFALITEEAVEATTPPDPVGDSDDDEDDAWLQTENIEDPFAPGIAGIETRIVGGRALVTQVDEDSFAHDMGVRPGWLIKSINGRDMQEIVATLDDELPPRLAAYQGAGVVHAFLDGPVGKRVRVEFIDGTDTIAEMRIRRRVDERETVQFGNLPPMSCLLDNWVERRGEAEIGVIRFNIWMLPNAAAFDEAIDEMRNLDGIVIDLRGNPGGIAGMAMGMAGHFIDEKVALGVLRTRGRDLKFPVNPRRVNRSNERVEPFDGPVAVLVDGMSASTSEVFAGGMQAIGRSRIFGEQTLGAALPAMMDRLPNGDVLLHAFADFLDPNGRSMEGDGVIPDETVPVTRESLLNGKDPSLDAALDWIARTHATRGERRPDAAVIGGE